MREIKFRFWLGHEKKMTYSHTLFEIGYVFQDRITTDVTPLQYTGLKDKNGKEIYEGDIVKWPYADYEELFTSVVDFSVGRFCIPKDSEIIGNVYENPELLNSEQNPERSVATEDQSGNKKTEK